MPRPLVIFLFFSDIKVLLLFLTKLKIEEKDSVVKMCTTYCLFKDTTKNSDYMYSRGGQIDKFRQPCLEGQLDKSHALIK